MRLLALALIALTQAATGAGPPMPYADYGACPLECCTYRDWTAEAKLIAYESHDPRAPKKAVFTIPAGARVTAMTGVVRTTAPGEAVIDAPTTLEVYSVRFPQAAAEKISLQRGDQLYLLTPHGEGWSSGWFNGRLLENFDAAMLGAPGRCGLRAGCTGTIVREAQIEWWVKVRNARGQIGWVLMPRKAPSFRGPDACGG